MNFLCPATDKPKKAELPLVQRDSSLGTDESVSPVLSDDLDPNPSAELSSTSLFLLKDTPNLPVYSCALSSSLPSSHEGYALPPDLADEPDYFGNPRLHHPANHSASPLLDRISEESPSSSSSTSSISSSSFPISSHSVLSTLSALSSISLRSDLTSLHSSSDCSTTSSSNSVDSGYSSFSSGPSLLPFLSAFDENSQTIPVPSIPSSSLSSSSPQSNASSSRSAASSPSLHSIFPLSSSPSPSPQTSLSLSPSLILPPPPPPIHLLEKIQMTCSQNMPTLHPFQETTTSNSRISSSTSSSSPSSTSCSISFNAQQTVPSSTTTFSLSLSPTMSIHSHPSSFASQTSFNSFSSQQPRLHSATLSRKIFFRAPVGSRRAKTEVMRAALDDFLRKLYPAVYEAFDAEVERMLYETQKTRMFLERIGREGAERCEGEMKEIGEVNEGIRIRDKDGDGRRGSEKEEREKEEREEKEEENGKWNNEGEIFCGAEVVSYVDGGRNVDANSKSAERREEDKEEDYANDDKLKSNEIFLENAVKTEKEKEDYEESFVNPDNPQSFCFVPCLSSTTSFSVSSSSQSASCETDAVLSSSAITPVDSEVTLNCTMAFRQGEAGVFERNSIPSGAHDDDKAGIEGIQEQE
ncbi:uncharacterized protein MONOS_2874 [Monocercomonoides exilis]|uniref:uncharacterized protein n=1 Tax=Monocercomonoides exilis TaxID=2049356 RepID=UPI0035599102|nr:hypothetical protein MONOS_2874 [Monocercomonoides exilis]|eukprot:MONOS_2874.1-p1 / transcript=MONOS_2874.1 / gene=MONOS_2874 / organism=Monocercomonoides_exilis_PA203 / gene_product=unspecified product / transcript_product=unspecified product / location=Mono_scaffold00062:111997-114634(-) / protein_length=638 / sequence_SO=supercontig / SO=protein_coding / is_pseudo=false